MEIFTALLGNARHCAGLRREQLDAEATCNRMVAPILEVPCGEMFVV